MRIAASSIAWPLELEGAAADVLARSGAGGVELAPTRLWPDLSRWDPAEADDNRALWTERGLEIVAMQAMLYGQPDLTVLGDREARRRTLDYLGHAIDIAERWGARALVFGSPKNRRAGDLDPAEALERAREFFAELAERAAGSGCVIGLEANPPEYGCDFLTRSEEAIDFVESIDHPGLGCHLDMGGMILSGEDVSDVVHRPATLAHFHASEPFLEGLGSHREEHRAAGRALRERSYDGWVSIEMRTDAEDPLGALDRAVREASSAYGGGPTEA